MIAKDEFINRIKKLPSFFSITKKASYSELSLTGNMLNFKRNNTNQYWDLNIDDVYEVYLKENFINTVILKKYLSGRVFSPSLGLLIATGLCDMNGNRKHK